MRSLATLSMVGLLCALPGCSSNGAEPVQVDTLYSTIATELCSYVYRCCEPAELGAFQNAFADQASCERYVTLLVQADHDAYRLAVTRGGVNTPRAALDACVAALQGMTCGSFQLSPSNYAPPFSTSAIAALDACSTSKLYVGTRSAGEACESTLACVAGTTCYSSGVLKGSGVCTALRKTGEPCASGTGGVGCDVGLVCTQKPTGGITTCQPPPGEGQPCTGTCDPAQPDLYCDLTKGSANAICVRRTRVKEGQPCTGTSSVLCEKELYCDYGLAPAAPVCARYHKGGEGCTSSMQCESSRCDPVLKVCVGQLCDGKNNGPPPQLDVKPTYPDYRPPFDYWLPMKDMPRFPDYRKPDIYKYPDLYKWPDIYKYVDYKVPKDLWFWWDY
jgi:hypothetical protein